MLNPSQKIKNLREIKKYTQEALADALGCSKSKVSQVEKGEWEYSEDDIKAAKIFFGIENAPFTSSELMEFRQRLYKWRDYIKNGLIGDAKDFQKGLIVINQLPFEPDLNFLYRMFEIRLFIKELNIEAAENMLLADEANVEEASEEGKHHFYYNMGSMSILRRDFKTALQFYLKAREFEIYTLEKDLGLDLNLVLCYSELGKYTLAIGVIEKVYHKFDYNSTGAARAYLDSTLAINYVNIGQVARAKELLKKSIAEAKGITDKTHIGTILHNYGCACWRNGEYEEAIRYFDQADAEYVEGVFNYQREKLENMYWKIRCLIALKKSSKVRPLLDKAKSLVREWENEHYLMAFESLSHLLTITKDGSIEFIEKKTIPYFIKKYEYYRVLHYCELLESIFKRRGAGYKTRALEMAVIIRDIINEITFGEEVKLL